MTEYEYIDIDLYGSTPSGKTSIWIVESKRGDSLGVIRWFGRWRQYVFNPDEGTTFSAGCLADIQDFIETQMTLREAATAKERTS